jgi:hypothetical protein
VSIAAGRSFTRLKRSFWWKAGNDRVEGFVDYALEYEDFNPNRRDLTSPLRERLRPKRSEGFG